MSNEVVILGGADDDLLRKYIELYAFSEATADEFSEDFREAQELIGNNPFIGSAHSHPPFRKWLLSDWDMAIFYRPLGNRCFIHAVLGLLQAPEKVMTILKSREQP